MQTALLILVGLNTLISLLLLARTFLRWEEEEAPTINAIGFRYTQKEDDEDGC